MKQNVIHLTLLLTLAGLPACHVRSTTGSSTKNAAFIDGQSGYLLSKGESTSSIRYGECPEVDKYPASKDYCSQNVVEVSRSSIEQELLSKLTSRASVLTNEKNDLEGIIRNLNQNAATQENSGAIARNQEILSRKAAELDKVNAEVSSINFVLDSIILDDKVYREQMNGDQVFGENQEAIEKIANSMREKAVIKNIPMHQRYSLTYKDHVTNIEIDSAKIINGHVSSITIKYLLPIEKDSYTDTFGNCIGKSVGFTCYQPRESHKDGTFTPQFNIDVTNETITFRYDPPANDSWSFHRVKGY